MPQLDTREEPRPENQPGAHTEADVLPLPIIEMARFRRLMHYEGWDFDLPRMCTDTAYAHERLATAHTSNDERLRSSAMRLFAAYDRNSGAAPVLH